uniref:Uncharacterized protein n=1 Tax=Heterorhabditis bacteriophora TaxID=37862 RepID=A0A1I7WJ52_HETBA
MPKIRTEPYFLSCGTELVKFVESDEQPLHFLIFYQKYDATSSERYFLNLAIISLAGIHKLKSVEGNKENDCEKLEHNFCNLPPKSQIRIPNGDDYYCLVNNMLTTKVSPKPIFAMETMSRPLVATSHEID